MFKPFRRRRIFMGLNVTVHGSEQLPICNIIVTHFFLKRNFFSPIQVTYISSKFGVTSFTFSTSLSFTPISNTFSFFFLGLSRLAYILTLSDTISPYPWILLYLWITSHTLIHYISDSRLAK